MRRRRYPGQHISDMPTTRPTGTSHDAATKAGAADPAGGVGTEGAPGTVSLPLSKLAPPLPPEMALVVTPPISNTLDELFPLIARVEAPEPLIVSFVPEGGENYHDNQPGQHGQPGQPGRRSHKGPCV
jgi:hypothetical protein